MCDNCPADPNPDQADREGDGIGDVCDNCPADPNPDQADGEGDGIGDACDTCPDDPNPDQVDGDGDGIGEVCDNCPNDPNPDQADVNQNGTGDACEPVLLEICGGLGAEPAEFISPKSKHVGFDSLEIAVSEDVILVDSVVTSTAGSAPHVIAMAALGGGVHSVQLDAPIAVGEWTTVELTVQVDTGPRAGSRGTLCFHIAHLLCDTNQDGQVNLNDATKFGDEFNGAKTLKLADLNGDGQVNLNDATKFGQIWRGTSGEGKNADGTGPWNGQGLPARPVTVCP